MVESSDDDWGSWGKEGWTEKEARTPEKEPGEELYTPTELGVSPPPLPMERLDTEAEDEHRKQRNLPERRDKRKEDKEKRKMKRKRNRRT